MRTILLVLTLGVMLSTPGRAAAGGGLGWHRGNGCGLFAGQLEGLHCGGKELVCFLQSGRAAEDHFERSRK